MRDAFYEESAISQRGASEAKKYTVLHVARLLFADFLSENHKRLQNARGRRRSHGVSADMVVFAADYAGRHVFLLLEVEKAV